MRRSDKRILTTHAGSLIRPQSVVEFDAARRDGGSVDESAYDAALADAVKDVVATQAKTGIDIPDDGEFSKSSWGTYINDRVSGFQRDPDRMMAINYTGRDAERFAEFFDGEAPGGTRNNRCLLYTSPSPRDGLLSRMPSSA